MRVPKLIRTTHYWGSLICILPVLIVIGSGLLLLLKKDIDWIQPPTIKTEVSAPNISFSQLLDVATEIDELEVSDWSDIDRLDVRPGKGVIKIRAVNSWEAQINPATGEVLQLAYRRSDTIESIHDGTWFHENVKLWFFLPAALVLLYLALSGTVLFSQRWLSGRKKAAQLNRRATS